MTETTRHIRITAEYCSTGMPSELQIRMTGHPAELGAQVHFLAAGGVSRGLRRVYTIEADPWHQENASTPTVAADRDAHARCLEALTALERSGRPLLVDPPKYPGVD